MNICEQEQENLLRIFHLVRSSHFLEKKVQSDIYHCRMNEYTHTAEEKDKKNAQLTILISSRECSRFRYKS